MDTPDEEDYARQLAKDTEATHEGTRVVMDGPKVTRHAFVMAPSLMSLLDTGSDLLFRMRNTFGQPYAASIMRDEETDTWQIEFGWEAR